MSAPPPKTSTTFEEVSAEYPKSVGACLYHQSRGIVNDDTSLGGKQTQKLSQVIAELVKGYVSQGRQIRRLILGYDQLDIVIVRQEAFIFWVLVEKGGDLDALEEAISTTYRYLLALTAPVSLKPPPQMTAKSIEADGDPFSEASSEKEGSSKVGSEASTSKLDPSVTSESSSEAEIETEIEEKDLQVASPLPLVSWTTMRAELERLLTKVLGTAQTRRWFEEILREQGFERGLKPGPAKSWQVAQILLERIPNVGIRRQIREELEDSLASSSQIPKP